MLEEMKTLIIRTGLNYEKLVKLLNKTDKFNNRLRSLYKTSFKSANEVYSNPMLSKEIWDYYDKMGFDDLWEIQELKKRLETFKNDLKKLIRDVNEELKSKKPPSNSP